MTATIVEYYNYLIDICQTSCGDVNERRGGSGYSYVSAAVDCGGKEVVSVGTTLWR